MHGRRCGNVERVVLDATDWFNLQMSDTNESEALVIPSPGGV